MSTDMIVRKLRLQRGWSQEQLAEMTGVSVRTIQRIEKGQIPGLETQKALASVFEVDISTLIPEGETMNTESQIERKETGSETKNQSTTSAYEPIDESKLTPEEEKALEEVRDLKEFFQNAMSTGLWLAFLFAINLFTSPEYIWAWWAVLGCGIWLAFEAIQVLPKARVFGPDWEKRQVEKRLGRKL